LKEEHLFRTFQALLAAAVLCGAASGIAGAQTHALFHRVTAGETLQMVARAENVSVDDLARINQIDGSQKTLPAGSVLALDEAAIESAPAPSLIVVPTEVRAQLTSLDVPSEPSANADLKMWSDVSSRGASALGVTSPVRDASSIKRFVHGIVNRTSSIAVSLTRSAMRFIGTPYVFGGTSPSGFDCSGYVQHVFAMLGIHLPRTADAQYYAGGRITNGIRVGDLVFFETYAPGPSHVGIYIGNGKFIHSSSHGVRVSRIRDSYWAARYLGAKRFVAASQTTRRLCY
jgi:cell wall-associated NlpC family hydrolase